MYLRYRMIRKHRKMICISLLSKELYTIFIKNLSIPWELRKAYSEVESSSCGCTVMGGIELHNWLVWQASSLIHITVPFRVFR